jgi:hypothetical protein
VVDSVELGRETVGERRRVDGPAAPAFRTVDAIDRTDGAKDRSPFGEPFLAVAGRRTATVGFDIVVFGKEGIASSIVLERADTDVLGVSLESGRGPGGGWALRLGATVLARDVAECVLRTIDFTEVADDSRDGSRVGVTFRLPVFPRSTLARRLTTSLSPSSLLNESLALDGVPFGGGWAGLNRSSTGTSISKTERLLEEIERVPLKSYPR